MSRSYAIRVLRTFLLARCTHHAGGEQRERFWGSNRQVPPGTCPEVTFVRRTSLSVATVSTDKDVRRTNRETISGQFLGQGLSALGRLIWSAVIFTFVGSLSVEMISATVQGSPQAAAKLSVFPESVTLGSPESSEQLIVIATDENGVTSDVTRQVTVSFAPEGCAKINSQGRVIPLEDGQSTLTLRLNNLSVDVPVRVSGITNPPPVSFRDQIIPILSKSGCNSGGCHGKAEGQNGFRLSVFGFDPGADYDAIVRDSHGRRLFPASPERSLFLMKATAIMPHGGGRKVEPDSRWHHLMLRWVREGAFADQTARDPVVQLKVYPSEITMEALAEHQLRATAVHQSGLVHCVTIESEFLSNNEVIAKVDRDGLVTTTDVPGEAAVLVRYMGHVAVCRITRPRSKENYPRPSEANFIDPLVWNKLERLHVAASPLADDSAVLRRTYLDIIGTLPTSDEARKYLSDSSPEKHQRLVAELLDRPEYADFWAQKWADILQIDKDIVSPSGAIAATRWIHSQFRDNVPYDRLVRTVLTTQGSTLSESPAAFYQVHADAEKTARAVSQLFLGVRIDCAQCHHHPFEKWDQKDYYALAGFFTGIQRAALPGGGMKISGRSGEPLKHPRTQEVIPAAALGESPAAITAGGDRRRVFAEWTTGSDNPFFARTIVNRLVAHYFGRGLVEPVDDLRETNPASNEPLMKALTAHMIEVRYDLKAFTKTLLNSQVYRLSSVPEPSNELDDQNYSRAAWKPIPAEVLLDAISQVTEVPEEFNGWPKGYRAIQIWDNKLPSHFLEVFGRPSRQTVCSCERGTESSIAQALHLMNSQTTTGKLQSRHGLCARLAGSELKDAEIIEELYLRTLSRYPRPEEVELMSQAFSGNANSVAGANTDGQATSPEGRSTAAARQKAIEDILWTLMNSREFVFNH